MYLCSQQEFKLALLLMLSVRGGGKYPSTVKDLEEFRMLIKSGIPLQFEQDVRANGQLSKSSNFLVENDKEEVKNEYKKILKEAQIAKLEVQAARALIKPDSIQKLDKVAKTAKTKSIKIHFSPSHLQEILFKKMTAEFQYIEQARALNVLLDWGMEKSDADQDSVDYILDCAKVYLKNLIKLFDSVLEQSFIKMAAEMSLIFRSVEKSTKRILDFIIAIDSKSFAIVFDFFQDYVRLLIKAYANRNEFFSKYGWDYIPATEHFQDPVLLIEESASSLIEKYGKDILQDAIGHILRSLLAQPSAFDYLTRILSKLLSFSINLNPRTMKPSVAALWQLLFDQEFDMTSLPLETLLYLDQTLLIYPIFSENKE